MPEIEMNNFPKIPQPLNKDWCIPACIQNVFQYYNVKRYSQKHIYQLFGKYRNDPYFKYYAEMINNEIPEFKAFYREFGGKFGELKDFLIEQLKQKSPVIISLKVPNDPRAHAGVILKYENDTFSYFDPNPNLDIEKVSSHNFEGILMGGNYDILLILKDV